MVDQTITNLRVQILDHSEQFSKHVWKALNLHLQIYTPTVCELDQPCAPSISSPGWYGQTKTFLIKIWEHLKIFYY